MAVPHSEGHLALPRWLKLSMLLLGLVKLWLVSSHTLAANGLALHDDRLFLVLADAIAQLHWLGPYDNLTLAKGPFYPAWIAFTLLLGVPLLLAQQLLYVFATALTVVALRPMLRDPLLLLGIFAVVLFNPISFDTAVTSRVIRAGIYPALTLLSVATAIGLLGRCRLSILRIAPWSVACGLSVAAFWLTREEGVWLTAFLVPMVGWTAFRLWRARQLGWGKLMVCSLPLLVPTALVHGVSAVNQAYYGVYATVDFKTEAFKGAYGALSRVKHNDWVPRVPVPREVRLRIYEQSPAFAELKPFLERKGFWTLRSLGRAHNTKALDEIGGGWFMWALRSAVQQAGYYGSGTSSAAYYRRLAREINAACEERRLDCLPSRASLMPPWRRDYLEPVVGALGRGIHELIRLGMLRVTPISSRGDDRQLILFRDMTGERLSLRDQDRVGSLVFVGGRAVHASEPLSIGLIDPADRKLASARFLSDPQVEAYFKQQGLPVPPHAARARFEVFGHCEAECKLQVEADDRVLARIALAKGRTEWFGDPLWVVIDDMYRLRDWPRQATLERIRRGALAGIGLVYQKALPVLVILALVVYGVLTWWVVLGKTGADLWIVSTLLVAAIVARLLILSLIDAMAFPAISPTYLAAAYPLVMLSAALLLASAFLGPSLQGTAKDA